MNLFLRRIWIHISADRRKFGALCLMVGVGLLLWARIIVISNLPRTAVADNSDDLEIAHAAAPTLAEEEQFVLIELATEPRRDPFEISVFRFPDPEISDDISSLPSKSFVHTPEDPTVLVERRRVALRGLVDELSLVAVMTDPPMAVIGGETLRVGERVSVEGKEEIEFTLTEVRERSVILVRDEFEFELRIPAPRGR